MAKDYLFFLLLLLLPTQFGKHFFLDASYIRGVKVDYLSLILYITDILVIFLALLNLSTIKRSLIENKKTITILTILFSINGLFSQQNTVFFYHLLKYVELYVVFVIIRRYTIKRSLIVTTLAIGAFVELILSILQLYFKSSLQGIFYFLGERMVNLSLADIAKASMNGVQFLRPYGTFSHPNSMAGFYLLVYFFILALPYKKNNAFYWKKILLLFFSASLVIISFSKVAIITFVLLNMVFLFRKKGEICIPCIVARIAVFIVLLILIFHARTDPLTIQKRWLLLQHGLAIFGSHILLGTGLGHYLYFEKDMVMTYPFFFLQPVHNSFLLFLAETGIVLGGALIVLIGKMIKYHTKNQVLLFCLGVIFLTGFFDHYWITLQQNWLALGVVFGFILNSKTFKKIGE